MKTNKIVIGNRSIGDGYTPLIIAEIGINHGGSIDKAMNMVKAASAVGCECVKFQCHIIEDEMIPNDIVPVNAEEPIYDMMKRCSLTEDEDRMLKEYTESFGMMYLSTPFSRAAVDRLERLGVSAYKIGSGECNNTPLVEHIAKLGKPVILSTGMNNLLSVRRTVDIFSKYKIQYALMHCRSIYPTPYNEVCFHRMKRLRYEFPNAVIGISDHSKGIYTCLGAVALGASILEKHFTIDKAWEGSDIPISIDAAELRELIIGSDAIYKAMNRFYSSECEESTAKFAYASVVTTKNIKAESILNNDNIWVKRPSGGIPAKEYYTLIGKKINKDIAINKQLFWNDIL